MARQANRTRRQSPHTAETRAVAPLPTNKTHGLICNWAAGDDTLLRTRYALPSPQTNRQHTAGIMAMIYLGKAWLRWLSKRRRPKVPQAVTR